MKFVIVGEKSILVCVAEWVEMAGGDMGETKLAK